MGIDAPMREHVVSWKEFVKETSSLGTAQTYLAAIKLFFKWTGQQGMYPDIAASVKGIRVGRFPKKDFLALDQVLVILKKAKEGNSASRDYAMVFLMVTCGLRVSEVAHADVGDLRYVGGEPILYVYGKGRQDGFRQCAEKGGGGHLPVSGHADRSDREFAAVRLGQPEQ